MTAIDDPAAPVARLVDAADQRSAALTFLRRGRALLEP
jgi:hypothetical protein